MEPFTSSDLTSCSRSQSSDRLDWFSFTTVMSSLNWNDLHICRSQSRGASTFHRCWSWKLAHLQQLCEAITSSSSWGRSQGQNLASTSSRCREHWDENKRKVLTEQEAARELASLSFRWDCEKWGGSLVSGAFANSVWWSGSVPAVELIWLLKLQIQSETANTDADPRLGGKDDSPSKEPGATFLGLKPAESFLLIVRCLVNLHLFHAEWSVSSVSFTPAHCHTVCESLDGEAHMELIPMK